MSNEALSWAWGVPCAPTAKLVLVAIADRANAAGECFPSSRDIVERTGLAERTVRLSLRELERIGALRTDFRAGRSTIYVVSMDAQRGASDAGGQEMPGGTTCPRNPYLTHIEPTPNPQSQTLAFVDTDILTLTPEAKPKREAGGTRLPEGWLPDDPGYEGATARTLASFCDYWRAAPGAKGRKSDWQATWRNWCRRDAERAPGRALPLKTSQWSVDDQNAELMRLARSNDHETQTTMLRLAL